MLFKQKWHWLNDFHKVSESDCTLGDLDLQGLALQVGEALVCHVQQRVSEKPAGTRMKHTDC